MPFKAGDVISRWGRYTIRHYQQHVKDRSKKFKPEFDTSLPPVRFPSCTKCPPGYPLYKLEALILLNSDATFGASHSTKSNRPKASRARKGYRIKL
jgi:hypothetical protein